VIVAVMLALHCLSVGQPQALLTRLDGLVDALLKKGQPPLFAWHLRSLRGLAHSEHAKLLLEVDQSPRTPLATREKEFVDYLTVICDGLARDCTDPDDYLKNGRRGLVLARPSAIEGSLQYFMIDLPKGWDPKKAYPLFVGLHGSGPDNPLAYPSFGFGPLSAEENKSATSGMIRLSPWGRGNRGWRGDAERDLFEAIESVKSFATLDPERWYLTGHSSGADGAWAILQHTPDLWAAAGIQSGSMISGRPEWGLMVNMWYVPTHIIIGEKDDLPNRIPDSKEAHRLITEMGGKSKLVIEPGIGHYPLSPAGIEEHNTWLVSHRRKRPTNFTFIVDQSIHPGVWGISVRIDPRTARLLVAPWPSFHCVITGSEVEIDTEHTNGLTIDLGPQGLQMSGKVKVTVNGKVVHDGPVPAVPISVRA